MRRTYKAVATPALRTYMSISVSALPDGPRSARVDTASCIASLVVSALRGAASTGGDRRTAATYAIAEPSGAIASIPVGSGSATGASFGREMEKRIIGPD